MADKKISDLPVASVISPTDVSVIVSSDTDYQFDFTLLLQFISANISTGTVFTFGTAIPQDSTGKNGDVFLKTDTATLYQKLNGTWASSYTMPTGSGADGTMLYGIGMPGTAMGANNDSYIDTSSGIFYLKTSGSWSQVYAMANGPQGPQGTQGTNGTNGTNGNTILQGTTNPSNSTDGVNGDYYINLSSYTFFGPKTSGVWDTGVPILGADGAPGAAGADGPAGTNGNTILSGTTDPVNTQGSNGDFYLNTATSYLFGPKALGAWPDGAALIGATGPTGLTGPAGATGAAGATGSTGANGEGVPAGGTTGQVLAKIDGTDFNTQWIAETGGSTIPAVTTGEKVVTQKPDGTHVDYDLQEQVVTASSLTTADFSTGFASVTGYEGQIAFDTSYRYDCVGVNQWVRSAINGNLVDLYLADIDDTAGDKTSVDLQSAYPVSLPGQQVWGTNKLYIKKTATGWKKLTIADA
jgi:hypothetical protein